LKIAQNVLFIPRLKYLTCSRAPLTMLTTIQQLIRHPFSFEYVDKFYLFQDKEVPDHRARTSKEILYVYFFIK